jgi:hypothetical protein
MVNHSVEWDRRKANRLAVKAPRNRSRHERTTDCYPGLKQACGVGSGEHRPDVSQRLCPSATGRRRHLEVHSHPSRAQGGLHPYGGTPITREFVGSIERFAKDNRIPLITFEKGQRKDDFAKQQRKKFHQREGVVFIGKAQEKCTVYRTEKRRNPKTKRTYPWIVKSTVLVNHYYFYCIDKDFGPFFLKFCSYFPYNAKLCLNGHEYLKQQLEQKGIAYQALDNGILSCKNPQALQDVCDRLSEDKIDALLRKWLRRLPHPFAPQDRQAGYRYQLSILQLELSLTQVLDRPVSGRIFFEDVIRENLDIGRPKQVQLIFDRWVTRSTPGPFRTRVITDGVIPSLHIDYKGMVTSWIAPSRSARRIAQNSGNGQAGYYEHALRL